MNRPEGLAISTEDSEDPRTNPKVNDLLEGIREETSEIKEMSEVIIEEIITGSGNPAENIKCPSYDYDSMPVIEKLEHLRRELRNARENYRKIIDVLR